MKSLAHAALALALGWVLACGSSAAQDVGVYPLRIVMNDRTRSGEVVVFNNGEHAGTYRIGLADKWMNVDGQLSDFDDTHPRPQDWPSAIDLVRFSPRQVMLAPGQSQSIRIALRRSPGLAEGEYRAHLSILTVPPPQEGASVEQLLGQTPGAISIRVTPLYGVSIPVIVRVGEASGSAELEEATLVRAQDGGAAMEVVITRRGDASVYGDLEVIAHAAARDRRVGLIRGVAVYPEIASRRVRIPLDAEALRGSEAAPTTIRYIENLDASAPRVLAETAGPPP